MALHYGDQEARRAVADLDYDNPINIQGEGYGVFSDDKDTSFNSPPPRSSEAPIQVHHQRTDPLAADEHSPVVSAGYGNLDAKQEDVEKVFPPASGYGDFEDELEEARRTVPTRGYGKLPDEVTKHRDYAINPQGEGYGAFRDDTDMSFNSPPPRRSEAPNQMHHQRNDPFTADKRSPVVSAGYENLEAQQDDGGEIFPPTSVPTGDYGRQPSDKASKQEDEGYTSLGIEESRDGNTSENSARVISEEENNSMKEREGTTAYESMAKALEDPFVTGGGIADVPGLKKDFVDLSEGNTDNMIRGREAGPPEDSFEVAEQQEEREVSPQVTGGSMADVPALKEGFVDLSEGNKDNVTRGGEATPHEESLSIGEHQEVREGSPQQSYGNIQEQEERHGAPQEALGIKNAEQVGREGGAPHRSDMVEEPEGGSATGSRGINDVQFLTGDHVDSYEASSKEPKIDDSVKGDTNELIVDDPIEASPAVTSQFTSQMRSPIDDPKQRYVVDNPEHRDSVNDPKQEFSRDEFSKPEDLISDDPKQEPASEDDFINGLKQEPPVAYPSKQEDTLDDLKQKSAVDDSKHEGSTADPMPTFSLDDSNAAQNPIKEKPTLSTESGGSIPDVPASEKDTLDFSEGEAMNTGGAEATPLVSLGHAEPEEREGAPQESFEYTQEKEEMDGGAPRHPQESFGYTQEKEETDGSAPHQSAMAKEPESGSVLGSRGVTDVQSMKGDYVDLSQATTEEPKVDNFTEDITSEPRVDESINDASHADTSQFTSQIRSPVNDPEQKYFADDPRQEFSRDESSKPEDVSDIPKQENPTEGPTKEEGFANEFKLESCGDYPSKPEDSLDDVKQKSLVDDSKHESSTADPMPMSSLDDSYIAQDSTKERCAAVEPASGGSITDVPTSKGSVDRSEGSAINMKAGEAAPQGHLGGAEEQPEREGSLQKSYGNTQEQEGRDGASQIEHDQIEREHHSPFQSAMAVEAESGSATRFDVQSLNADYADLSKISSNEPKGDDSMKGDSNEPKVDNPTDDASRAPSHIRSPVDEMYSIDDHKQGSLRDESGKPGDFSLDLKQEIPAEESSKEGRFIDYLKQESPVDYSSKQEDSLDDLNQKSPVDEFKPEVSIDDPMSMSSLDDSNIAKDSTKDRCTVVEPAPGGSITDVPNAKDSVDWSEGHANNVKGGEAAPQGYLGSVEQQPEREGSPGNTQEQEGRDGVSQGVLGIEDDQAVREHDSPFQSAMAIEPESGSATGSRGLVDVQSLNGDYADLSKASLNEAKVDDSVKSDAKDRKVDDPTDDASRAASQIRSPFDKMYSVVDTKHEFSRDESSKPGDFSLDLKPETPAEEQQEESLDDLKQKSLVDESKPEVSIDDPLSMSSHDDSYIAQNSMKEKCTSEFASGGGIADGPALEKDYVDMPEGNTINTGWEKPALEGSLGNVEQQEEREVAPQGSFGKTREQEEKDATPQGVQGVMKDEQAEREGGASHQSPMAEELSGSASGSRGIIDVQSMKGDYVDLSGASTEEFKAELGKDEQAEIEGGAPLQSPTPMAEHVEGGSGLGSRGIIDVQPMKGDDIDLSGVSTQKPKIDDSVEGRDEQAVIEGGASHQSPTPMAEDLEGGPATEAREASKEELTVDDSREDNTTELKVGDSVRDFKQEFARDESSKPEAPSDLKLEPEAESNVVQDSIKAKPTVDENVQEDLTTFGKPLSPLDDAKQLEHTEPCPTDDDMHGCESFQDDDGKEKIKAEGYNIYTGAPENVVYDAADVTGDQQEKRTDETEADAAVKPFEDYPSGKDKVSPERENMEDVLKKVSGFDIGKNEESKDFETSKQRDEHEESFTQHVRSAVKQDVGFKADAKDEDIEDATMQENAECAPADKKAPYADVFRIDGSELEQDAGLKTDSKDKEYSSPAVSKEADTTPIENIENVPVGYISAAVREEVDATPSVPASEESPYNKFPRTEDFVKTGYGPEGIVPKHNEEVDRELREPIERVDQEEDRRPTDEHPLDKSLELDSGAKQVGDKKMVSGDVRGVEEGAYGPQGGIAFDQDDAAEEAHNIEVPTTPPSLPHPGPEDANYRKGRNGDDGEQHNEARPHKKGVFEKFKEKLHLTSH